jgi:DNA polymerase-1
VNSRDQLEVVLYDELKLSPGRKTQTGKRSTAASALEELQGQHEIIERILAYRELTKLKNTYLDPLPKLLHPKTGRLHTRFNQTGTATGRLSSVDPNLQNIPIRTEIGRRIRKAFRAAPGMKLVVADYSQIELRVLAHLSGDENLIKVFREGKDIHTQTAAWMFGLDLDQVRGEQRRAAKTINFGVLYGMSAHRLSNELAIPYAEAERFIERYFASYPRVRAWIEQILADARQKGYVETMFGRRRFVADLDSRIRSVREAAERMAFNMPVQGTAADLMKLAMVKLQPELEGLEAHLVLQVHDELLVEAPADKAEQVAGVVREVMQKAWALEVPLEVGTGIGENWLEAK